MKRRLIQLARACSQQNHYLARTRCFLARGVARLSKRRAPDQRLATAFYNAVTEEASRSKMPGATAPGISIHLLYRSKLVEALFGLEVRHLDPVILDRRVLHECQGISGACFASG